MFIVYKAHEYWAHIFVITFKLLMQILNDS